MLCGEKIITEVGLKAYLTLTFDPFYLKSNLFICVSKCTKVVA